MPLDRAEFGVLADLERDLRHQDAAFVRSFDPAPRRRGRRWAVPAAAVVGLTVVWLGPQALPVLGMMLVLAAPVVAALGARRTAELSRQLYGPEPPAPARPPGGDREDAGRAYRRRPHRAAGRRRSGARRRGRSPGAARSGSRTGR